jgi:hypothetical protein
MGQKRNFSCGRPGQYYRTRKNHDYKTTQYCSCAHWAGDILLTQVDWPRISIHNIQCPETVQNKISNTFETRPQSPMSINFFSLLF